MLIAGLVIVAAAVIAAILFFRNGGVSPMGGPSGSAGKTEAEAVKETEVAKVAEKPVVPPVSDYLSGVANDPSTFDEKKLDEFTLASNSPSLATLSLSLLKLREAGSPIPEKILMKQEFNMQGLALDPRVTLEGYIYDTYKNKKAFDPVKLQSLPIVSQETLSFVLREMFLKDKASVLKVSDAILKRQQSQTSRQFNITANFLRYVRGEMKPANPKLILAGQANFFLKWPGWNTLKEDERQTLLKGSRIFQHYQNTPEDEIVKNIDTEIAHFQDYVAEYKKSTLYTEGKWLGTVQLYFALANLYALKGDYDKGATFFKEAYSLKFKAAGQTAFDDPQLQLIGIREGYLYMAKGDHLQAAGKKQEALDAYKLAAKTMKENLLVRPFVIDGFAIWWDLNEKIKKLGG